MVRGVPPGSSKSTPSATAQPTGSVIPPPATPTLPTQLDEVAAGIGAAEQADGDSGLALGALIAGMIGVGTLGTVGTPCRGAADQSPAGDVVV